MDDPETFDPRDFSVSDWDVIINALRDRIASQKWKADRPGIPGNNKDQLLRAAERRGRLIGSCIGAKAFLRREDNG